MRRSIQTFINHRYTDLVVTLLIIGSVGLLVAEALLSESSRLFEIIEFSGHVLTGIFIVELAIRFYAMPNKRRFLPIYWLDIIAVIPVMRSLRILRVLRLLRLFRIGAMVNRRMSSFGAVFRKGKPEILMIGMIVLVVVLAGAIGINLAEQDSQDGLKTIGDSVWWSLYSLIAGEPVLGVPQSFLGRTLTLFVMLGGLCFFATFTGIISAAMVNRLSRKSEVREMMLEDLSHHIVICGWNRMGTKILDEFQADKEQSQKPVVVITEKETAPEIGARPAEQFFFISGDSTKVEVLKESRIEHADIAIILADKSITRSDQDRDARTILTALTVEKLNTNIFTCVELLNRANQTHLSMAGVEEIVVPDEYSGKILATASRNRGVVALLDELFTSHYGNQIYKTTVPDSWTGKEVRWVHQTLKEEHDAILLAIEHPAENQDGQKSILNPPPSELIQAGDNITLIAKCCPQTLK
jgi:voltage-gated potassium channel